MFAARHIPYQQTQAFTRIVLDYLSGAPELRPFYQGLPSWEGIEETLRQKQAQPIDRKTLVSVLQNQYAALKAEEAVGRQIDRLLQENTFTVCTAHQPNLFTGPLYFMYKILHAIRLADALNERLPSYHFVPVYYMGSEDADFAELNHTFVDGRKIEWKKEQKGAVGRMKVDQTLIRLIGELEGQLYAEKHGPRVIALLREAYSEGKTIQDATFELVHKLYGALGLVVLIPDHPQLKAQMRLVFADDLFPHVPAALVQESSARLEQHYEAQAYPRDINLFYLKDDIRERIVRNEEGFEVLNTDLRFSEDGLRKELDLHPERFSPNVILRGLYQETILPNLAFIGGGGELAYWLQLKPLFEKYGVVYPVLVLRNSFLVLENKWVQKIGHTELEPSDFFFPEHEIMNRIVAKKSTHEVSLNGNFEKAESLYEQIRRQAESIDPTLSRHVAAIRARSMKLLQELEKKMVRAEKRKFGDQQRTVEKIRAILFPNNGLQERVENFSRFYAKWGPSFIEALYRHSLTLEQQFTILSESTED